MKSIICISTTPWKAHFTSKQQVMSRLTDCKIAYIDPPVTMIARFKDKSLKDYGKQSKKEQINDNFTVYRLPLFFPFYNKYRWINKLNQMLFVKPLIAKIKKEQGFEDAVLWTYTPTAADVIDKTEKSKLVYHCVDRHSAYKGMISAEVVDGEEKELCEKADVVFTTATGLYETLAPYNPNTYYTPNGVDFNLFNSAYTQPLECPEEIEQLAHPIFGFVGYLQEWVDYEILDKLAKERPDGTVLLIGPIADKANVDKLLENPNVVAIGAKPQKELPAYIRQFDVCLNVFRKSKLSKDVSPLKFYEYMATGKPIVSTEQPAQVTEYADVIYIASDGEQFVKCCNTAVLEVNEQRRQKQLEYAEMASWDKRVENMRNILKKHGV